MQSEENVGFLKVVKIVFYAALVLAIGYLFFTYIFSYLLPFIIAYLIAMIIQPIVRAVRKKLRIPPKLANFIVLIIVLTLLSFLAYFVIERTIYELNQLLVTLQTSTKELGDVNGYIHRFQTWVGETLDRIPLLSSLDTDQINAQIAQTIYGILNTIATKLLQAIPNILAATAKVLPSSLFFTIILIVSTFYISFDFEKINLFFGKQLSPRVNRWITEVKNMFMDAISRYLKAYVTIMFITFCELAVGFLIIGIPYSFLLAFIISIIDILPVLGTGTVLIPWAIISLATGNLFEGLALLILYAVLTVVRHIIEPKIVGNSLGIYPVVTLVCMYIGFNLFGFAGLLLFPISFLILQTLNDTGRLKLWKKIDTPPSPPDRKRWLWGGK